MSNSTIVLIFEVVAAIVQMVTGPGRAKLRQGPNPIAVASRVPQ